MGDRHEAGGRPPVLHETLVHPSLPTGRAPLAGHGRAEFAADALLRAEAPAPGEPLQMQPLDGLVALDVVSTRATGSPDYGYPADVAAWWDLRCVGAVGLLAGAAHD